jgi:glycosyltransferase involved in cell wall biosynthesis
MYKSKKIAVVIPAHNEEKLIKRTVTTIPDFVDKIIVIDDCSTDKTADIIKELGAVEIIENNLINADSRILLVRHMKNRGVGGAISTGYKWCRDNGIDAAAVMAGDAQMDPSDLHSLVDPVVSGLVDYCKGNRLFTGEAWKKIPKTRYIGNSILSFLTKIASGYWQIADSQSGYTVINAKMLKLIDWDQSRKGYGCPNDYLVRLNVFNAKVCDVPVKPVYGIGEVSGIRLHKEIPRLSWLIIRLFWWRMIHKYVIRDFHPLILFYIASIILTVPGFILGADLLRYRILYGPVAATSVLFAVFLMTMGVQFGLFAMWFDMESNKHLNYHLEDSNQTYNLSPES